MENEIQPGQKVKINDSLSVTVVTDEALADASPEYAEILAAREAK
jgi:hypothetical protein